MAGRYKSGLLLIAVLLMAAVSVSFGAAPVADKALVLSDVRTGYVLGRYFDYLEDPSGSLTISDVASPLHSSRFSPHLKDVPSFGFTDSAYWLRVTLVNQTDSRRWVLEQTSSWINSIQLYTPDPAAPGEWLVRHVGDAFPFAQREVRHANFILPLGLEIGQAVPLYIRIASPGAMITPFTLWEQTAYDEHALHLAYFIGAVFGVLGIMFLYNLFISLTVRDSAYLYYILFVASVALMTFTSNGYSYMYLWPDSPWLAERMQVAAIALLQITGMLFARRFLNTRDSLPGMDVLIRLLMGLQILLVVLLPLTDMSAVLARATLIGVQLYSPVLFIAGVLSFRQGNRAARFFLLGWISSIIGSAITSMAMLSVIDFTFLAFNAATISVVIDVALLSFALADRIRVLRDEKEAAHRRVTQTLEDAKVELEQKVQSRTEQMQAARDVAEQASQAKTAFLSSMSHELRTPLNAIIGFSELLGRETRASSSVRQEYIDTICSSGRHLLSLVNNVQHLSSIESGRFDLNMQTVSLRESVAEAAAMMQGLAEHHGVTVHNRTADATDHFCVRADPLRLKQVVINLLSNAVKYNRKGGHADVVLERVDDKVQLTVSDTGKGIPQDQLVDLFEPFTRVAVAGGHVEGTGIGLTIAYQLVELMEGSIEVESTLGEGSRFSISLPAVAEAGSDESVDALLGDSVPSGGLSEASVLYIEDNPVNRRLMEAIFAEQDNLQLVCADTGQAGISMARSHRPDLILSDIGLPDLDGALLPAMLQGFPETRSIPMVALSANAINSDIERALAAGYRAYLTKPVEVDTLLRELRKHLPV